MNARWKKLVSGKSLRRCPVRAIIESLEDRALLTTTGAVITLPAIKSPGSTTSTIRVVYNDTVALDPTSIAASNISVTDPNSQPIMVAAVKSTVTSTGHRITATYTFDVPGGAWGAADNGNYGIAVNTNQVKDTSGNFIAATNANFIVNLPRKQTTVTVSSNNLDPAAGESVTFTAHVPRTINKIDPTGSVTFFASGNPIGTATVNTAGVATLVTTSLPTGISTIGDNYSGDANYAPATSTVSVTETLATSLPVQATATTQPPASVIAGVRTRFPIVVTLTNPGTTRYVKKLNIAFYLSTTTNVTSNSPLLFAVHRNVVIRGGKSEALRFFVTSIPVWHTTEALNLLAAVTDSTGSQSIVNAGTVNVVATKISLAGTFLKSPATVTPGDLTRASLQVSNNGNNPILGKVTVALYLSTSSTFNSSAFQLKSLTLPVHLPPGRSIILRLVGLVSPTAQAGTSFLLAQVDTAGAFGGPYAVNAAMVTVT